MEIKERERNSEMYTPFLLSSTSSVTNIMHEGLVLLVNFTIPIMEFMGLIVLINTAFKSFIGWLRKDARTNLHLAEGLEMALSFKLGGEILRTVVVHTMDEIILVGAITILRAFITLLLQFEIRNEEKKLHESKESEHTKKDCN